MQKRYLIDMFVSQVEADTNQVAGSQNCCLLERPDSAKGYGIGQEKRFDVVRRSGNVPIAVVGLAQEEDGTHLLVTDEPHSQRQGESFDHDAFADFADSLLASLSAEWKVKPID
jgi:hypothetical protein